MFRVLCCFSLLSLSMLVPACSGKKDSEPNSSEPPAAEPGASTAKPQKLDAPPKSAGPTLPPGPYKIARTPLKERLSTTRDGQQLRWQELGQIAVSGEEFRQVYRSRGKNYVSFKAELKAAANCLVDWRVELIAGPTGRGKSLGQIKGLVPTRKGESLIVSGVTEVSDKELPNLASASAGYWSVCAKEMPSPSVHQLEIASATAKQIKLGTEFDIHHTAFTLSGKAPAKKRCFMEVVVEDRDKDGYTLNRDFTSFSISSNKNTHEGLLRRTTFEGGAEKDYEKLATNKIAYLRKMRCVSAETSPTPKIEGIEISELTLAPNTSEPKSAEHLARQSFGHSAVLHNTSKQACSFHLRYRILDKEGLPLNRTSIFSETVHLAKDATVNYKHQQERLFVWLDHRDEVGSLSIESALPVDDCKAFDPTKALH